MWEWCVVQIGARNHAGGPPLPHGGTHADHLPDATRRSVRRRATGTRSGRGAFADDVKRRGYEKYLASVREDTAHSRNFFASLGARRHYAKDDIVCFTIDLGRPTGFPVRE